MEEKNFDIDEFDIDEDLDIDPNQLDVELLRQPSLFGFYGQLEAQLKKERDEAWENSKITRSRLIQEAWDDPSNIPGGKANAQTVEAYYRNHEDHIEAKEQLNQAEFNLNLLSVAISKVRERRYTLIEMVKLMGMEYFAGPDLPRNLGEEYQQYIENKSEKIRGKVKDRMKGQKRTRRTRK